MPTLAQVIAVLEDVKKNSKEELTAAHHKLQQNKLLFGISRTYQPMQEDGTQYPPESTLVQARAKEIVEDTARILNRLFDIEATRDWANCEAKADIVVDEKVLLAQVPATYLLYLSKQLVDVHTFVEKLPVLDPAEQWQWDESTNCFRNAGKQTIKTSKKPVAFVKYPATKEHPAQVEVLQQDLAEGTWSETKFSGALPATLVRELLDRVEKLQAAVKFARETANSIQIKNQSAKPLFDFLFGSLQLGA